jgi:hypothetical protein
MQSVNNTLLGKISASLVLTLAMLSYSVGSKAASLGLTLYDPDITSQYLSTNYNATTDLLTIDGGAGFGNTIDGLDIGATFTLVADISAGGILNSGTINISGYIEGDLLELGYENNGGQVLEFTFNPTGGSLLPDYLGNNGGIILSVTGYNDNDFNTDFTGNAAATFGNTAPIPVPAAVWLFGSALMGFFGFRRKNGQNIQG